MKELFALDAPPGAALAANPTSSTASSNGGFDPYTVLAALRHRWWTGLLVAPALAAAGAFVATQKLQPSYSAEALLTVQPTLPSVAVHDEEWRAQSIHGFRDDYTRTLVEVARTREVLEQAVAQLAADGTDWLPAGVDPERAIDHLRARLQVRAVRDTHLMTIGFDDSDPDLVAPMVNIAARCVMDYVEGKLRREKAKHIGALEDELERVEGELAETYSELDALSPRLGSALLDERQNPFYERVNTLEEGLTGVLVDLATAKGDLDRAKVEAELLRNEVPEAQILGAVELDVAVRDARVMLGRLERDEESATGHLSDVHPDRRRSLHRLGLARERVAKLETDAALRARLRLTTERQERADQVLAEAEAEVCSAERSAAEMRSVLNRARTDLSEHGRAMFDGSLLRDRADRLLNVIGLLESKLEGVRIESRADARVALASAGVTPSGPSSDKRKLALLASIAAAIGAALATPIALELLLPRLRHASDLGRAGIDSLAAPRDLSAWLEARLKTTGPTAICGVVLVPAGAQAESATRELASELGERLGVQAFDVVDQDDTSHAPRVLRAAPVDAGVAELCAARGLPVVLVATRGSSPRAVRKAEERLTERGARVIGGVLAAKAG
ncbi:MAG: hypothetical protein AAFZ65_03245 [Planctomycetota bacterium]